MSVARVRQADLAGRAALAGREALAGRALATRALAIRARTAKKGRHRTLAAVVAAAAINRQAPGGQSLLLICLSKKDGSVRWQKELDRGNKVYNKQNSSSPSPVTDGKHVWVVTGNGVVTASISTARSCGRRTSKSNMENSA